MRESSISYLRRWLGADYSRLPLIILIATAISAVILTVLYFAVANTEF